MFLFWPVPKSCAGRSVLRPYEENATSKAKLVSVHRLLAQTRQAIQTVCKVVGYIAGAIAVIAPIGMIFFVSVMVSLACFAVWILVENLGDSGNLTMWPPSNPPK
jgi:hypothetical protein